MGTTTLRTTDDTTALKCFLVRHTHLLAHASFDLTSATRSSCDRVIFRPATELRLAADVACPFGLGALVHAVNVALHLGRQMMPLGQWSAQHRVQR